jgi:hypothetical protein
MNWEALGAIGEIVGAVAVVLTLGYLAVQIRQNTRSARASTSYHSTTRASAITTAIAQQKDLAHLFRTGLAGLDQLEDDDDRIRFVMLLSTMLREFDDLFFQYRVGNLSLEQWETWRQSLRNILGSPGFSPFWELRSPSFTESFRKFIEAERKGVEPRTIEEALEEAKRAT